MGPQHHLVVTSDAALWEDSLGTCGKGEEDRWIIHGKLQAYLKRPPKRHLEKEGRT